MFVYWLFSDIAEIEQGSLSSKGQGHNTIDMKWIRSRWIFPKIECCNVLKILHDRLNFYKYQLLQASWAKINIHMYKYELKLVYFYSHMKWKPRK